MKIGTPCAPQAPLRGIGVSGKNTGPVSRSIAAAQTNGSRSLRGGPDAASTTTQHIGVSKLTEFGILEARNIIAVVVKCRANFQHRHSIRGGLLSRYDLSRAVLPAALLRLRGEKARAARCPYLRAWRYKNALRQIGHPIHRAVSESQ